VSTFAVVTGGGTSGHVLPALAVADALVVAGHDVSEIHYVGCTRGIETELLPATPYPHTFFDVVGFQRSFGRVRTNAEFAPKLWRARGRAIRLLRQLRPNVVVSVGGYASMPAVLAARKLDIPVVVVSYDMKPGRASQVAARKAAACAVAFPGSSLPRAELTGAPVRQSVLAVDRAVDRDSARHALGVPADRFLIAVMGGSLGSGALNTAVEALLDACAGDTRLAVRHAVGRRFVDAARAPTDGVGGVLYQPIGYEPEMPTVYAAADLLIGRGGASTVHEVAVTGIPAILVPWAGAAENHQVANVKWLSDADAAVYLAEAELARLPDLIAELRRDRNRLAELSANAHRMGAAHRQGKLAALIERVAESG
jgi:UDP-N-acetylglucosamine--N-acetylmuramyl-(pentapeptide) pyrophosphoryl-undecaprenol N-acetylglucosamine transferase